MKFTPKRHKETNRFKFQPFSQRISHLDVDVFHRIGHKNEEYDEEETFLYQAIRKWNVLNLSDSYEELRKELPPVNTLPMLLHERDLVIDVILKHLAKRNPLSLETILDLLAALMKDLRYEVYSSYGIILQRLCELLSTKNADELEWTFTCLAYVFKYLWRYIVKDVDTVFDSLVPLFSDSNPEYIRNFAAESFAYVVRKVKNKKDFVNLLLTTLENRPDGIEGCGRLMFEVLRGVRGRFHSFAQDFLPLVLDMLYDASVNSSLLFDLLTHMFSAMCSCVESKYFTLVWTTSFEVIFKHQDSEDTAQAQLSILRFTKQIIHYKGGVLLVEPQVVVTNILKLLEDVKNDEICMILSEILGTILMSPHVRLTQDVARRLTMKALMAPYEPSVLNFICQILQYTGFETLILPWVQNYVCNEVNKELSSSSTDLQNTVLDLLLRIVLQKGTPCLSGINLENWKQYPLDLAISSEQRKKEGVFEIFFHQKYSNISSFKDCNIEELIIMLLVLPHVKMIQEEIVKETLNNLMVKLCSELQTNDVEAEEKLSDLMFLFLIVLESSIHILDFQNVKEVCSMEFMLDVVLPMAKQPSFISALHAIDLYITAMKVEEQDKNFCVQLLKRMHSSLSENLLSPYHQVRQLTLHLFSLFVTTDTENHLYFFKICLEAESLIVNLQNIREKLLLLEKLSFDVIETNSDYLDIPLQYLLGVLYENFQLIWEPVTNVIVSYAKGMPAVKFWKVFGAQLRKAVQNVVEGESSKKNKCSFSNIALTEVYDNMHVFEDRLDYSNYRILLWKAFAQFPELCDIKSKDVSPLLLNFLEQEYLKVNSDDVQFCSVLLPQLSDCQNVDTNLNETNKSQRKANGKSERSHMYQALLAHMNVFAKLRNPKAIHKEPQLHDHYFNLLASRNSNVQKIALDCLMAYKEKYLSPYSEHLYGLLNDDTFKTEVTLFRVDKESSIIQQEHRAKLLPVILRILYGRMLTKTGHGSTGRGTGVLRRSLVLRFLAGCHESEMIMFLQLSFKVYLPYLQVDTKIMVDKIAKEIDLNHVIGLKSLRSSLNVVLVVMEKFGSLMGNDVLSFVLHILISIGALISSILAHRTKIYPAYGSGVRKLQSTAIMAVAKFFSHFTEYHWVPDDLEVTFTIFVWLGLEKLPIEGIHSPTALLKLFLTWSRDPRYFHLLNRNKDSEGITPLGAIMNLLRAPKIKPSVSKTIMDIVAALLTTSDFTEGEQENYVTDNSPKSQDLNYGSKILLPHVPVIIQHLQHKLTIKKKKGLGSQELLILSRVSELHNNAETSENLLQLLFLAFLKKVNGSEETVIHLVSTICTLWKNVCVPFQYLKCIAPLFGNVSTITGRRMLCNVLTDLAEKDSTLNKDDLLANVQLIRDINAWDPKWLEQPDYVRRLDGFKSVHQMIQNEKIILHFGLIIVYNCFYILRSDKDLSLKDAASYCLRKLCPFLCKQAVLTKNSHVPETILKLITAGIREKSNDSLHDEAILLLGELVHESCDTHPTLLDLKDLACKEDIEVDFFHNMVHLQNHRRARALMRFCSVAKQMVKPPRTQTMTQIILPLVTSFLCTEKYATKRSVVEAATVSIGVVCNFLPWFHYDALLRFYLSKLRTMPEFQKQLVRVIVSILDAFHFDVSSAEQIPANSESKNIETAEIRDEKMESNKVKERESGEEKLEKNEKTLELSSEGKEDEDREDAMEEKEGSGDGDNDDDAEANTDAKQSIEEELENAMDDISVDENERTEENEVSLPHDEPFILQSIKLSATRATTVIRSITKGLLPKLQQTITLNKKGSAHKVNRKKTAFEQEQEDTMCIPVALAIVKLLQRLPSHYLEEHLPGVFMNICAYLKSRLESVRRVAREMLQKIMESLGPLYLSVLLNEMIPLLTKGYQKHVLIFTIHSVLSAMKSILKPGDLDECLCNILKIVKMDLFGEAFEEKKVIQITGKIAEARSHKSYNTLHIAAQFITEKCFVDILLPFKEVLEKTHSYSTVVRVSESLHQIVKGLSDNAFVSAESLLIFIYGVVSGSIAAFKMNNEQPVIKKDEAKKKHLKESDTFLIPKAPRTRYGALMAKPNLSSDRNAHVLVEFGFQLLHVLLKRGRADSDDLLIYIDPLVPVLQNNIDAKHVKLTTVTLQCFKNILKMDLPNLKTSINTLTDSIFSLLHKYASCLSQGEYLDMIVAAYKAVTVLIGHVKYHLINDLQLKTLLLYIEQGMQDFTQHATAFPLLKAILTRKLDVPEIYQIMIKVARISVTSDHDHVRAQARLVVYHYLMNYPLGYKVDRLLNFYLSQLRYELEPGRLSAYQIIHRMIATFPEDALAKYAGVLFVAIGAALVNDPTANGKKMAAKCLKTLIIKDETDRDRLFNVTVLWMKDQKIGHRCLGAQVCGIFVEVETEKFLRRLEELLPIIQTQLIARMNLLYAPGKCVRLVQEINESEEAKEKKLRLEDHCIFQILQLIKKLCSLCPAFLKDETWMSHVENIAEGAQNLLSHPHLWIRLEASAVLGFVFASLDIKALVEAVSTSSFTQGRYLFHDTGNKLKSLALDFCDQLIPNSQSPQLIEQVTKNLAFLCRVINVLPEDKELPEEDEFKISLLWLIRRMRKIINSEVVRNPSSYTLREAVFKWIGALVVDLTKERLQSVVAQVLAPLARELLLDETHPELLHLAKGVAKIIKKKIGEEEYTNQLSKIQMHINTKRAKRKKERAQEFINNPVMAAKRKIEKQQKKKLMKKRKMDEWKGRVAPRKKRKSNSNYNSNNSVPKKKWIVTEATTDA